jgi:hypothetical protein
VGGTVLVLRADLRDFALRDYHRWWAFLSETLLPLYVVRPVRPLRRRPGRAEQGLTPRKWRGSLSGCASDAGAGAWQHLKLCVFFPGVTVQMHSQDDRDRATVLDRCAPACLRFVAGLADGARPRPRHAHLLDAAAAGPSKAASPDTPRSVLPWRRSLSSPASTYISPSGPAAEPPLCEAAATAAALLAHKDQPGTKWGVSGPHWGHREPAEAACCADAAWFRQRLASNCVV